MSLSGRAVLAVACLLLSLVSSCTEGRKVGHRNSHVGHESPRLQSPESESLFVAAMKRYEPYASLELRDAKLPCTIERRRGLSRDEFEAEFWQKKPVVLVGGSGLREDSGPHGPTTKVDSNNVRTTTVGVLSPAQMEVSMLLTRTYAEKIVRIGRPEEVPRGSVERFEQLAEFLRRPYTEDDVRNAEAWPAFCCHL